MSVELNVMGPFGKENPEVAMTYKQWAGEYSPGETARIRGQENAHKTAISLSNLFTGCGGGVLAVFVAAGVIMLVAPRRLDIIATSYSIGFFSTGFIFSSIIFGLALKEAKEADTIIKQIQSDKTEKKSRDDESALRADEMEVEIKDLEKEITKKRISIIQLRKMAGQQPTGTENLYF